MANTNNSSKVLEYIDQFIQQQEDLIVKAKAARDFFAAIGEAPGLAYKYRIPSRSGDTRPPHIVTVTKDEINCTCPAGSNDKMCWAMKGIEEAVNRAGSIDIGEMGSFYDGQYTIRYWERA